MVTGLLGLTSRAQASSWQPSSAELVRPQRPSLPREAWGLAGALRLVAAVPRLASVSGGDGHVVVDVPGWKAPEAVGAPLRAYLRNRGYDARGWGLGTNQGRPEHDAERLGEIVRQAAIDSGQPVSLVCWSLGGLIGREVARQHPDAVRRVITYGTPVVGGPAWTVGAGAWGAGETARISDLLDRLDTERPIHVPMTVIYTDRDAIVTPAACIDQRSPSVEHVRVSSTHLGLVVDPDVWAVVADRLAIPAGHAAGTRPARR